MGFLEAGGGHRRPHEVEARKIQWPVSRHRHRHLSAPALVARVMMAPMARCLHSLARWDGLAGLARAKPARAASFFAPAATSGSIEGRAAICRDRSQIEHGAKPTPRHAAALAAALPGTAQRPCARRPRSSSSVVHDHPRRSHRFVRARVGKPPSASPVQPALPDVHNRPRSEIGAPSARVGLREK